MRKISTILFAFLCMAGWSNVTAQTDVFLENFDGVQGFDTKGGPVTSTGGNDGGWSGSVASGRLDAATWVSTKGWSFLGNDAGISAFAGKDCIKLGTGSVQGAATTPALAKLSGNAILTFKAGAWNGGSEKTTLLLEITGGGKLSESSVTMQKGVFSSYTVYITDGTAATKVTFKGQVASNSRFFLDEVKIVTGNTPTTSSDATLSEIQIDGAVFEDFEPTTLSYFVVLPASAKLPVVTATTNHAAATAVVTNVASLPGYAYIDVTAENPASVMRYQIHFSKEAAEGEKGSKSNPFTVAEAQANQLPVGAAHYWVHGFIVGTIGNGPELQTEPSVATNLALAATATETNVENIIPVALPSGDIRTALNPLDNPGNMGKEVLVYGTLETYFSVPGIRNVSDYQLLDVSGMNSSSAAQKSVFATPGQIIVNATAGNLITVYDILGKVVVKTTAGTSETVIPAKAGQVLLVKVGKKVSKVITK